MDSLVENNYLEEESAVASDELALRQRVINPIKFLISALFLTIFIFVLADSSSHAVKAVVVSANLLTDDVYNTRLFRENFLDERDKLDLMHGSQIDCVFAYPLMGDIPGDFETCEVVLSGKPLVIKSPGRIGWQGCTATFDGEPVDCFRMSVKDGRNATAEAIVVGGPLMGEVVEDGLPKRRLWRTFFYFRSEQEILMWISLLAMIIAPFSALVWPLFLTRRDGKSTLKVGVVNEVVWGSLILAFVLFVIVTMYGFLPFYSYFESFQKAITGLAKPPLLRGRIIGISGVCLLIALGCQSIMTWNADGSREANIGQVIFFKIALTIGLFMTFYFSATLILFGLDFLD